MDEKKIRIYYTDVDYGKVFLLTALARKTETSYLIEPEQQRNILSRSRFRHNDLGVNENPRVALEEVQEKIKREVARLTEQLTHLTSEGEALVGILASDENVDKFWAEVINAQPKPRTDPPSGEIQL